MRGHPGFTSTLVPGAYSRLAAHGGELEVGVCRKLCEDGQLPEAVDALNTLVQRGCHVPNSAFYIVLRRCIAQKDLVLGRRIHALTVKTGSDSNAFLVTHLIGLYASDGKVEEAMRVFSKVTPPSAQNWASIIFAYAKHGRPTQAIRLYRQMRETAVQPDNRIFVAVLKACARAGDLAAGKDVHASVLATAREPDMFVQTCLVDMYAKCGSLGDARRVFDELPQKNVVTWTAMIAGYAKQGMGQEGLSLYCMMQQEGITPPNSVTYVCLLQACATAGVAGLHQGKQLHAQIEERGLQDDVVIGASLVNMYSKIGSLKDARRVFDRLPHINVVTWTTMIAGYAQHGLCQEALSLYYSMQQKGLTAPNSVTFVCLLQACAGVGAAALDQGKQLHAQIEELGIHCDVVVGGSLVNMYIQCGSLENAQRVFARLAHKNLVTWTTMVAGYAQEGMGQEALCLYSAMLQHGITKLESATFVCLLQACASLGVVALHQGQQLHAQIEEQGLQDDVVLGGSLVNMYAKCGSVENAQRVFDKLPRKNLVTWTAVIAGYVQQGMGQTALDLYSRMQHEGINSPDSVTFGCLLQACAHVGVVALRQGMQLHSQIEERGMQIDVVLGGSLVSMYAKFGSVEDARRVFDKLPQKNVVTWTAMIACYAQQGMGQEALSLYNAMQQEGITPPNSVTFVCLLQACASIGEDGLLQGKQLHAQIEERGLQDDVAIGASLVNMYAKCRSVDNAQKVFDKLSQKNVVTWNAMITGYAQQGMAQEALSLYSAMQQKNNALPDSVTYVSLLQACASIAALPLGKQLHAQIEEQGLQADVAVGSSLVNMYAKCGSLAAAQQVFDSLVVRDVVAWSALVAGYARQGDSEIVFGMVDKMKQEGVHPNSITFLSVLTVCSHVGLVDQGRWYFEAMGTDYSISPTIEHYTCMMDLLGRAGHLDEALQMAKSMPCQPNVAVWISLLGACRKWCNVEIGREAFDFAVSLDDKDAAPYILMSNIYADSQMWEEAKEMQAWRVRSEAWKQPGQSWWTDMDGVVHTFVVGDIRQ